MEEASVETRHESVAITGANGRLGRALSAAMGEAGYSANLWQRPELNLDDPQSGVRLVDKSRPSIVYHCAAWTDVDGCARDPRVAMLRNGETTRRLAEQCAAVGASLVYISTNEVFDGERTDGQGYREEDVANPANAYGQSKRAGEIGVWEAFESLPGRAWVVRISWLFGSPGNDFPAKILGAFRRLGPDQSLSVVADEYGRPTYSRDVAHALVRLPTVAQSGTYHLANQGVASRYDWAIETIEAHRLVPKIEPIPQSAYQRASHPPIWGVLDTTKADRLGLALRSWRDALATYLLESPEV